MRLFVWKREYYPQSADEEMSYISQLTSVGLAFEAKQSASENVLLTTMNS